MKGSLEYSAIIKKKTTPRLLQEIVDNLGRVCIDGWHSECIASVVGSSKCNFNV